MTQGRGSDRQRCAPNVLQQIATHAQRTFSPHESLSRRASGTMAGFTIGPITFGPSRSPWSFDGQVCRRRQHTAARQSPREAHGKGCPADLATHRSICRQCAQPTFSSTSLLARRQDPCGNRPRRVAGHVIRSRRTTCVPCVPHSRRRVCGHTSIAQAVLPAPEHHRTMWRIGRAGTSGPARVNVYAQNCTTAEFGTGRMDGARAARSLAFANARGVRFVHVGLAHGTDCISPSNILIVCIYTNGVPCGAQHGHFTININHGVAQCVQQLPFWPLSWAQAFLPLASR